MKPYLKEEARQIVGNDVWIFTNTLVKIYNTLISKIPIDSEPDFEREPIILSTPHHLRGKRWWRNEKLRGPKQSATSQHKEFFDGLARIIDEMSYVEIGELLPERLVSCEQVDAARAKAQELGLVVGKFRLYPVTSKIEQLNNGEIAEIWKDSNISMSEPLIEIVRSTMDYRLLYYNSKWLKKRYPERV